jgi:hypothetical protein
MAHLRERSTTGGWINFAVFQADAISNTNTARSEALAELTHKARANGLRVDQAALAFRENGRTTYYGNSNLVDYLSRVGIRGWTHTLTM